MSSRWYPIYSKGNPQLRVFLPNFWMKMVENKNVKRPPNAITFQVSPAMTQLDVKNYLEKIYKVPVLDVKTKNVTGKTEYSPHWRESRELFKDDDIKYAFVTVPMRSVENFKFPDLEEITKDTEDAKDQKNSVKELDSMKQKFKQTTGTSGGRKPGIPTFFGI